MNALEKWLTNIAELFKVKSLITLTITAKNADQANSHWWKK